MEVVQPGTLSPIGRMGRRLSDFVEIVVSNEERVPDVENKETGDGMRSVATEPGVLGIPLLPSARRYSLSTAQMIEESRAMIYAKNSRPSSRRQSITSINASSRTDLRAAGSRRGSQTALGLAVPSVARHQRRGSSPNIIVPSMGGTSPGSRRGSMMATLTDGLPDAASMRRLSAQFSAPAQTGDSSTGTGLLNLLGKSVDDKKGSKKRKEDATWWDWLTGSTSGGTGKASTRSITSQASGILSYKTRLQAFILCYSLGLILASLGSCVLFLQSSSKALLLFVIFSFVGNTAIVASMTFMASLAQQRRQLFQEFRSLAVVVFLLCLMLSVVVALKTHNPRLVILCIIVQFTASTWYAISYIPILRNAVKRCVAV